MTIGAAVVRPEQRALRGWETDTVLSTYLVDSATRKDHGPGLQGPGVGEFWPTTLLAKSTDQSCLYAERQWPWFLRLVRSWLMRVVWSCGGELCYGDRGAVAVGARCVAV